MPFVCIAQMPVVEGIKQIGFIHQSLDLEAGTALDWLSSYLEGI